MFDEKRFKSFKMKNRNGFSVTVKPKLCVNWKLFIEDNVVCLIDDSDQEFAFFYDDALNVLSFLLKNNHQLYSDILTLEMIIDRKRNLCTKEEYEEHLSQELKNNSTVIPASSLIRGKAYVLEDQSVVLYLGEVFVAGDNGKVSKKRLVVQQFSVKFMKTEIMHSAVNPNILSKKVIGPANMLLILEEQFNANVANILKRYKRLKDFVFLSTVNPLCSEIKYTIHPENATRARQDELSRNNIYYNFSTSGENNIVVYNHNYTEIY